MEAALEKAKHIIQEEAQRFGVRVQGILLFGSRARGEAHSDSDWDLLIVVDRPLERPRRLRLAARIGVRLVLERMPADVLILSEGQFEERRGDVGHIAYYAAREGVPLL